MSKLVSVVLILFSFYGLGQSVDHNTIYDSLLTELESTTDELTRFHLCIELGRLNSDQRIEYLEEALLLQDAVDSTELVLSTYNSLARAYWIEGKAEKSIETLYQLISQAKEKGYAQWEANATHNLANSLSLQKKYVEASKLLGKATSILLDLNDSLLLFYALGNRANNFFYLEKYDSAKILINEMGQYYLNEPMYQVGRATQFFIESNLLALDGEYDSAILLHEKGIRISNNNQNILRTVAKSNIELGSIFLRDKRNDLGIPLINDAYMSGVQNGFNEIIRDAAESLTAYWSDANQFDSAFFYQSIYYTYRDSITNLENIQRIESLRADFEIDQKQAELDVTEQRRRTQTFVSISIGAFLLVSLIAGVLVYRNYLQKLRLSNELTVLNESKNKLLSIISHDLRGPMAAFTGVAFMIKAAVKSGKSEMLLEVADEVEKSSKRLSGLLETLLHWAIRQQGNMDVHREALSVRKLFKELKETYSTEARNKQIELVIDQIDQSAINVDGNMTYTIFRNLISNALKFTSEGGRIEVSSKQKESFVEVKVADTGVGIPSEKLATLFEFKGEQVSFGTRGEKGLGLGLSLVKQFVDQNGGTIEVASELNKGTTFTVLLPAA